MLRFSMGQQSVKINNENPTSVFEEKTMLRSVFPLFSLCETTTMTTMRRGNDDVSDVVIGRQWELMDSLAGGARELSFKHPSNPTLPLIFLPEAQGCLPKRSVIGEMVKTGGLNTWSLSLALGLLGTFGGGPILGILCAKGGAAIGIGTGVGQGIMTSSSNSYIEFCEEANDFLMYAAHHGPTNDTVLRFARLHDNADTPRERKVTKQILQVMENSFGMQACVRMAQTMFPPNAELF